MVLISNNELTFFRTNLENLHSNPVSNSSNVNRIIVLLVGKEMEVISHMENSKTTYAHGYLSKWRVFHQFILDYAGFTHIAANLSLKIIVEY